MFLQDSFLEKAWDDLLSRDTNRILTRFASLDAGSQKTVLEHLNRMAVESGWHPEQVLSAKTALLALGSQDRS
jgi:hypothetical protein